MLENIIALIDSNGNTVVQYNYDAWGNHKVVNSSGVEITDQNHIGNLNPFRYRGYYYDRETGLYFLQTRYYDPVVGRFLNRDSVNYADPETISGLNLYAYCLNNPVAYTDPTGHSILALLGSLLVAGLVGATIEVAGTAISDVVNSAKEGEWQWSSWETYVGSAIGGFAGGMTSLIPVVGGYISPIIASSVGTFSGMAIENATGTSDFSWAEIAAQTVINASLSALTIGMTRYAKIPGITKGSHSWQQVFKSGWTKTLKYGYSMSVKTLGKEAGYLLVSGFNTGFAFGVFLNVLWGFIF